MDRVIAAIYLFISISFLISTASKLGMEQTMYIVLWVMISFVAGYLISIAKQND